MSSVLISAFVVALAGTEPEAAKVSAPDPLASSKTWSEKHASHLLRRAGFGGTPEQISYLVRLGRADAVRYLVDYENITADPVETNKKPYEPRRPRDLFGLDKEERQRLIAQQRRNDRALFEEAVGWWLETMVTSPRPLEEKLVLFWHGHFTSGYREVRSSHAMLRQNELLRRHASGSFRAFLLAITEDPAMVLYLNTQQNRRGSPNENYARELLELFTMGAGNYTEADIKEAARAFTGIMVDMETGETVFRARQHDDGEKTFLGRTGTFKPADIIDIILEQDATARHMARRFWRFFAYDDPDEAIVDALAAVLRDGGYEFKPMLKAMFMSDAFYSKRAMFTNIKSPVELLVGTMRALEIAPGDTLSLNAGLRLMGQSLMQPPNVKGWDGGATWITASTLYNRYNVLGALVAGNDDDQSRRRRQQRIASMRESLGGESFLSDDMTARTQPPYDPRPHMKKHRLTTLERIVDHYAKRLLQRPLNPAKRKLLIETARPIYRPGDIDSEQNAAMIRGLIHLIVSMPEYQLS